jgi:hypothetical protein
MSCIGIGGSYCFAGGVGNSSFASGIGAGGFPVSGVERIVPLCCYRPLGPGTSPPSIDGDISHADDPMELDDPE